MHIPDGNETTIVVVRSPPPPPMHALNVTDALAFLDAVKAETSPAVYNSFLDIMKNFKTQTIGTPKVCELVAALFQPHPNLIQGFNVFLPDGWRLVIGSSGNMNLRSPNGLISPL